LQGRQDVITRLKLALSDDLMRFGPAAERPMYSLVIQITVSCSSPIAM